MATEDGAAQMTPFGFFDAGEEMHHGTEVTHATSNLRMLLAVTHTHTHTCLFALFAPPTCEAAPAQKQTLTAAATRRDQSSCWHLMKHAAITPVLSPSPRRKAHILLFLSGETATNRIWFSLDQILYG